MNPSDLGIGHTFVGGGGAIRSTSWRLISTRKPATHHEFLAASAGAVTPSIVFTPASYRPDTVGCMIQPSVSTIVMRERKRLALIAHDNCKAELLEWARFNRGTLTRHALYATGTTGALLSDELGLPVVRFASGPLGGDQQVGAAIVEERLDFVIFFWDPLEPQPHDVDVKALLRIAVVYNVPIACNRSTADFLLSSPLMEQTYDRRVKMRSVGTLSTEEFEAA